MSGSRTVYLLLALITLLVYLPARNHGFLIGPDETFVTDNPVVQSGLTRDGVQWAFQTSRAATWHPVTWLSHMLDCRFFGLSAAGPHLVNVTLHAINTILLYALLMRLTRAQWSSAFIAALFAWHPLQVESVAWVAERREVLSAFFGLLTLTAYVEYVLTRRERTRHPLRRTLAASAGYALALVFFALGLMSKPALAMLPLAMLLLDFWPLQRGSASGPGLFYSRWLRLVMEKWPFFALGAGGIAMALLAQQSGDASIWHLLGSLRGHLGSAMAAYGDYLLKTACPVHLSVVYPSPRQTLWLHSFLGGAAVLLISWIVLPGRQRRPYLVTGWLWFLVMLLPAVAMPLEGGQLIADHCAYIPLIGLFIALGFGAAEVAVRFQFKPLALGLVAGAILAGCLLASSAQLWFWGDNERLFTHALAVTGDNPIAHNRLGLVRLRQDRVEEAIPEFLRALELQPEYAEGQNNLGEAYLQQGKTEEAIRCFEKALELQSRFVAAHNNLGTALLRSGRLDEALAQFLSAVETESDDARAHENLGLVFLQNGHPEKAATQFEKALRLKPNRVEARFGLGMALLQQERLDESIPCFRGVLEIQPDHTGARSCLAGVLLRKGALEDAVQLLRTVLESQPDNVNAENNLAWVLATCPKASLRDGVKAVELAELAERLSLSNTPAIIGTVAAAYAEAGRFPDAVAAARRALQVAAAQRDTAQAGAIPSQLACYEAGYAFRDSSLTNITRPAAVTQK